MHMTLDGNATRRQHAVHFGLAVNVELAPGTVLFKLVLEADTDPVIREAKQGKAFLFDKLWQK